MDLFILFPDFHVLAWVLFGIDTYWRVIVVEHSRLDVIHLYVVYPPRVVVVSSVCLFRETTTSVKLELISISWVFNITLAQAMPSSLRVS